MSFDTLPLDFTEAEEATDLVEVTPAMEDEDTDIIARPTSHERSHRDTSRDGSDLAFLFRMN